MFKRAICNSNPTVLIVGLLLCLASNIVKGSADIELIWQKRLDASIHASPLITSSRLIACSSKGKVSVFDLNSGHLEWSSKKGIRFWDRSLVVDKKKVYAGSPGGKFQAYSLIDGKLIWSVNLGIDVQVRPLLVGNTLYVPTTHVGTGLAGNPNGKAKIFAIDSKSGDIKWSQITENYALQKPAFNGKTLFVAGSYYDPSIEVDEGGPMRVNAYNLNGEPLWEHKGLDGFTKAIHADEKAVAYVGYQDFITALNTKNGSPRWRRDTGNWTPSLIGDNGVIYYGSATTFVYAVASDDGDMIWKFNIGGGSFNYLLGEPVISGDRFYFLTQKGDIYALNLETGEKLWVEPTNTDARTGVSVNEGTIATGGIDGSLRVYRLE